MLEVPCHVGKPLKLNIEMKLPVKNSKGALFKEGRGKNPWVVVLRELSKEIGMVQIVF